MSRDKVKKVRLEGRGDYWVGAVHGKRVILGRCDTIGYDEALTNYHELKETSQPNTHTKTSG